MNTANLSSLAKVGAATAAGAFFGALQLTAVPTTVDGWKVVLLPALGAALFAELTYLRAQLSAFLAAASAAMGIPAPAPSPTTATAAAQPAAILAKAAAVSPPGVPPVPPAAA